MNGNLAPEERPQRDLFPKRLLMALLTLLLVFLPSSLLHAQTPITSLSAITAADGHYTITQDIDASAFNTSIATFSGTLEAAIDPATHMPYRIKNLSVPLFTTLTGTVRNLVIENVSISGSGNTGTIARTANGIARIYNVGILGGTVGGSGYTGGLVGLLDGTARVVTCYSFATITGGTNVGGLVGYNNQSTASNNLRTMIFGCMFYGDITGGTDKAPIYNGMIITNNGDNSGVNGFNYVLAEAPFVSNQQANTYNCALLAETRFLQRFEFFRLLLNSHRELAAWWATGNVANASQMLKWVMLPDSIGSGHPYPVLMQWGRYPSVVNIDAANAQENQPRNQGGKLGELQVTVQMGDGAVYTHPSAAAITTSSLTLNITDKDTAHFNFNYYKVQLPYYNDVGTGNYTGNRVVAGWKIVSITGGTPGTLTTGADAVADASGNITSAPYNFADRNCTAKDLYSTSGRVFNQGAYWDVPEGVTAITIEPYWAKAVYFADDFRDVVFTNTMGTKSSVTTVGGGRRFTNGANISINGSTQTVYSELGNAVTALYNGLNENTYKNHKVYDYAAVLIGTYHRKDGVEGNANKPYTVMSIDLDGDNEPDGCFVTRIDGRTQWHPARFDFLPIVGLGMAQKTTGKTGSYNIGIPQPIRWFEITNTSLFRVTQFEYDRSNRDEAPIILQGGVIEQWVCGQNNGAANKTTYYHVGGNVWFKEFHRGTHQDNELQSKHPPVSVTGGDYDEFYLTGLYRSSVTSYGDNAECYINGGRFGTVCGAAQEGIGKAGGADNTGNIVWQIQNADIHEFYGGGLNATKPVEGNITTVISDSHVDLFCGGPKFGDMNSGKTVVTTATGCTFGVYFGAGYGGNSYSRQAPFNYNSNVTNIEWNRWVKGEIRAQADANFTGYHREYKSAFGGVSAQFNYQFLPLSNNTYNVARLFIEYVKFSLATTRSVTSTLNGCTITSNFYGGGSLGKVDGPVTSTLNDCTVRGNVFGAGFSAALPTVEMDSIGFRVEPRYYTEAGTYRIGVKGTTETYTWQHANAISVDNTNHILYTTEDLTTLGTVVGNVTLTIGGNSVIGTAGDGSTGSIYGGGEESAVGINANPSSITVTLQGNTKVLGSVFGGGKEGAVNGDTHVTIQD